MMRTIQSLILSVILIPGLNFFKLYSQETPARLTLDKGSIENSFNYVIKNASPYEDSKVVKSWWLWRLRSYTLDSLNVYRDSITYFQNLVEMRDTHIDSLMANLQKTGKSLKNTLKEKDTLAFLGINMSKMTYNSIMWSLIAILVIALAIVFLLFKRSNAVTVRVKSDLSEINEEFEAHRKRALEREQKIAREMYDEIIKYKNKYGEL